MKKVLIVGLASIALAACDSPETVSGPTPTPSVSDENTGNDELENGDKPQEVSE